MNFEKLKKLQEEWKESLPKAKPKKIWNVGRPKTMVLLLWGLLLFSTCFAIYKNFTAIDIHTVHEKEIMKQEIIDTSRIEHFVKNFGKAYYSWEKSRESIQNRSKTLSYYLSKELQDLNLDTIRPDIPTSSSVNEIQIWAIDRKEQQHYHVVFYVDQTIKEGENSQRILSSYQTTVHVDEEGNLVIIQNPTICSKPTKSSYEPKKKESLHPVDSSTQQEITEFLNTFFTLYPKATKQELSYYVEGDALKLIGKDYLFAGLISPIYEKQGEHVKVWVTVKYLDDKTKMVQLSQFELMMSKEGNWRVVR